jgi:hypothetical protein
MPSLPRLPQVYHFIGKSSVVAALDIHNVLSDGSNHHVRQLNSVVSPRNVAAARISR